MNRIVLSVVDYIIGNIPELGFSEGQFLPPRLPRFRRRRIVRRMAVGGEEDSVHTDPAHWSVTAMEETPNGQLVIAVEDDAAGPLHLFKMAHPGRHALCGIDLI